MRRESVRRLRSESDRLRGFERRGWLGQSGVEALTNGAAVDMTSAVFLMIKRRLFSGAFSLAVGLRAGRVNTAAPVRWSAGFN